MFTLKVVLVSLLCLPILYFSVVFVIKLIGEMQGGARPPKKRGKSKAR